ncbi:antitoxin Xre/MbcA/ParS toxin-binding domain-containing protein [Stenotrophomonas sp. 2694]|uniref:antitoxin Xre/MbcA/ParS toxin-binding domain-containing protein n=1 Tax=Stenotrophomonas sp. 2694 TaxID=3156317 RepID=UPI00339744A3
MTQPFSNDDPRLAGPALMAFTKIADAWSLTVVEQSALLAQPVSTAFTPAAAEGGDDRWQETLTRVSYLIGIYQLLHTIFSNPQQADSWVRRPNKGVLFKGDSALQLMCGGRLEDLAAVRRHLEIEGLGLS